MREANLKPMAGRPTVRQNKLKEVHKKNEIILDNWLKSQFLKIINY